LLIQYFQNKVTGIRKDTDIRLVTDTDTKKITFQ